MQFELLIKKALQVRALYEKFEKSTYGRSWTKENIAQGFVGDVGDLIKLVMAKEGIRGIDNVDIKLAHELSDCLWSVLILAHMYGIDLEMSFVENMNALEAEITIKQSSIQK